MGSFSVHGTSIRWIGGEPQRAENTWNQGDEPRGPAPHPTQKNKNMLVSICVALVFFCTPERVFSKRDTTSHSSSGSQHERPGLEVQPCSRSFLKRLQQKLIYEAHNSRTLSLYTHMCMFTNMYIYIYILYIWSAAHPPCSTFSFVAVFSRLPGVLRLQSLQSRFFTFSDTCNS